MKRRVIFLYDSIISQLEYIAQQIQADQVSKHRKANNFNAIFRDLLCMCVQKSVFELNNLKSEEYEELKKRLRD